MAPTGTLLCISSVALIKPLKKENKQTINKVNLMCIIIQSRAGLFKDNPGLVLNFNSEMKA